MLQMYVYTYLISDLEIVSKNLYTTDSMGITYHTYNPNPYKYPIHKHGMKPKLYEIGTLEQMYWS